MEILLLEDLAADAREWLAARYRVDYRPELLRDLPALQRELHRADALVAPVRLRVNSQLLDHAPRLVVLGRLHEGGENIDFESCQRRGVRVVQATSAATRATAEFLLMALLNLFRLGGQLRASYVGATPRAHGREINDSVVGLFGMSPVAQLLAPMLVALGARVVGYDPAVHRSAELWERLGVQPLTLAELLETSDAVSMQTVYASRYRGLVNDRVLASCRHRQLWACVSRASLFDPAALARCLRSGRIEAFWMDSDDAVLDEANSPLRGLPNLRITSGWAARTGEAQLRGSWYLADRMHQALAMSAARGGAMGPDSVPMSLG
ncbi:MAG TPA: NAD(P)-dependent oxidoreductase [Ottowia sp.]|uniref:NAD(P)-dependent oxidoreductase n=1 Tax=Ottowia sp. TaxID=1898956 RepID=UPI002C5B6E69|nr:NAD(P)-dependent oxidoreductase [Ottowia sp.]HMN22770.1 NAD(P)-dependent oxidoreductase [Ottowia sp.]